MYDPIRFAAQVSAAESGPDRTAKMRLLEDLGFDSILVPDQMVGPGWSSMPALAAAAVATTDLRVGNLALNNDMRNPVVLAREAATLDVISGGRYELGLGAGWLDRDYQSTAMAFDRGRVGYRAAGGSCTHQTTIRGGGSHL